MIILAVFNLVSSLWPPDRLRKLKTWLLRKGGLQVGDNVRIAHGVRFFGKNIRLGDDCWVGINSTFYASGEKGVVVGARCDIGPEVMFVCGTHSIGGAPRRAGPGMNMEIVVGDGVWVCARSCILGGAIIGPGTIVAAGSVVLAKEFPVHVLLAGNPAVVKRLL